MKVLPRGHAARFAVALTALALQAGVTAGTQPRPATLPVVEIVNDDLSRGEIVAV